MDTLFTFQPSLAVGVLIGPASKPLLASDSIVAAVWCEDVCAWVLSLESDCWMSSPTCGHTASCGSFVLFLCLKMAAAAWHSHQQVVGGLGD